MQEETPKFVVTKCATMTKIHPQFIVDTAGKKMVVLPQQQFDAIMEELEELEDIKRYDAAKQSNEPSYPIDEAFKMIEAKRKTPCLSL